MAKLANILVMITVLDKFKTPRETARDIALNMRTRRKELKLTQKELSKKSGVSLGSLKRFEQTYDISLDSLLKIAFALGCEEDFFQLFTKKFYRTIEEVINERNF